MFSVIIVLTNVLFLLLGALLYLKAEQLGVVLPAKSDDLFPTLALQLFPPLLGLLFIIGLISALFPSADGALTALTASSCLDLLGIRERGWDETKQSRIRKIVHVLFALLFWLIVLCFYYLKRDKLIDVIYDLAAITYGPLLGLFAFGIFTRRQTIEPLVPAVCVGAAVGAICYGRIANSCLMAMRSASRH